MGYSASLEIVYGVRLFDLFPEGIRIQRNSVTRTDGWGKAIGQFNLEEAYLGSALVGDNKSGHGMRVIYDFSNLLSRGGGEDIDEINEKWRHYSNYDGANLSEWIIGLRVDAVGTENVIQVPSALTLSEIEPEVRQFLHDRFNYTEDLYCLAVLRHSYLVQVGVR